MRELALHSPPPFAAAAVEQFRIVGLAVRREAILVMVVIVAPTALGLVLAWARGGSLGFGSLEDLTILGWWTGVAAFFAPVAVWKGERSFGSSPLWCLPVDHRRSALIKVAAGGAWLLLVLAAVLLWFVLLALLTGGAIGGETTRNVLDASAPAGYHPVTVMTPAWQWLAPFSGAVAVYMVGSAIHLGTKRPWIWLAGSVIAASALSILLPESGITWLEEGWDNALQQLTMGRFGFDAAVAGGVEGLETIHRVPSRLEGVNGWLALPTIGRWAGATLLWLGLGLTALLAATWRPRHG